MHGTCPQASCAHMYTHLYLQEEVRELRRREAALQVALADRNLEAVELRREVTQVGREGLCDCLVGVPLPHACSLPGGRSMQGLLPGRAASHNHGSARAKHTSCSRRGAPPTSVHERSRSLPGLHAPAHRDTAQHSTALHCTHPPRASRPLPTGLGSSGPGSCAAEAADAGPGGEPRVCAHAHRAGGGAARAEAHAGGVDTAARQGLCGCSLPMHAPV